MFSFAALVLAQCLAVVLAQESGPSASSVSSSPSVSSVSGGSSATSASVPVSSESSSGFSSSATSSELPRSSASESASSAIITAPPSSVPPFPTTVPATGTNSLEPASAFFPPPPAGGQGVSPDEPPPVFAPGDEFDTQSLQLATYQEQIELNLFNFALANFTPAEFDNAGINASQRFLIEFWGQQESGHVIALNNILGSAGVEQCQYQFPFNSVRTFIDFGQTLTRWGEAGVYGFLPHMTSRPAAQILLQTVAIEAKQQEGLAQMEGRFPTPFWFSMGLPQTFAWSFLAQFITSCPKSNPRINFNLFPLLFVTNQPDPIDPNSQSAVSTNNTQLFNPGDPVNFSWEPIGVRRGPPEQGGYFTASNPAAGPPKFAAFIHQLNVTYQPLTDVNATNRTAQTTFPDFSMFNQTNGPNANGTVFVALTDQDVPLNPFNISLINNHTLAVGWLRAG